jgi:hypothetical protein
LTSLAAPVKTAFVLRNGGAPRGRHPALSEKLKKYLTTGEGLVYKYIFPDRTAFMGGSTAAAAAGLIFEN